MECNSNLSCPVSGCSFDGTLSRVIHHITEQEDSDHTWEALGYQNSWQFRTMHENGSNGSSSSAEIDGQTPSSTGLTERLQSVPLEDVPGIGDTRAEALSKDGYTNAIDIADASISELKETRTVSEKSARCIQTTAREACGYQDPFITELSESLDVDRRELADAYADLAPTVITPEEAKGTLERLFGTDTEHSVIHLTDHALRFRHYLIQAGFDTLDDVSRASIDELTEVSYIGDRLATSLRESARATLDECSQTHESGSVTGESQESDPDTTVDDDRSSRAGKGTGRPASERDIGTSHSDGDNRRPTVDHDSTGEVDQRARELLKRSIGPDAEFRPDQLEAINSLVTDKDRLLLVQRTGWGKSTVYFIATKLLREQGHGPTLIISPLLALMHNQVQDAWEQLGLEAWTINSNNTEEWAEAEQAVVEGSCDLLLVSPERLANSEFQEEILLEMDEEFGMLVVDEAHCISDWGHDFRPDYRRIKRILQQLPEHIPVAATTATANDRVVDDVTDQVPGLRPVRGDLVRESLRIQTNEMDSRADRLAWLAENVPGLPSSGIIYCLTTDEVETVAEWLRGRGLDVEPYHGGMDGDQRRKLEERLMNNDVDGLVATNALGMGFNKPDLGWVIHFQRPPNLIRYYQEIGRAGRELDEAFAILFSGEEDDRIAEFFIEQAFPEPEDFETVLSILEACKDPLHKHQILKLVDISWRALTRCLDILRVDNAIIRVDEGFKRTSADWSYDYDRVQSVTRQRWDELERIKAFVQTEDCLTRFIDDELDGSLTEDCGECANCMAPFLPADVQDEELVQAAMEHYRADSWDEIPPRYYIHEEDGRSKIEEHRKPETGRVLSVYGDPGYGELARQQQNQDEQYSHELVDAASRHIEMKWDQSPKPTWVTPVPSGTDGERVEDLAQRIAERLDLEYVQAIDLVRDIQPQHELANSYQKRWNVEGAFEATAAVRSEPVLLVDDTVGSRWTFTEASLALRDAESGPVYPFALADRSRW